MFRDNLRARRFYARHGFTVVPAATSSTPRRCSRGPDVPVLTDDSLEEPPVRIAVDPTAAQPAELLDHDVFTSST